MPYLEELLKKAKSEVESPKVSFTEQPLAQEIHATPEDKVLIDQYDEIKIYKKRGEPLLLYEVPAPRYRGEEKALIETILDLAARTIKVDEALFQTGIEKRARYLHEVKQLIDLTPELKIPSHAKDFYAGAVVREMMGFGLIDPLIADDKLEEVMVIGIDRPVYVFHRKYEMMKTNVVFYSDKDIVDLIDKIARNIGRRIDISSPLLDARLPDGTRINATIPPASLNGSTITVRKFKADPLSVIDLVNNGTLNYEVAAFLWTMVEGMGGIPANVIIAGSTASGKTTLLNTLTSFVPNYERLITIEDTSELALPFQHWIRLEGRPPGLEGVGEITLDDLLKNSLRMRPDRIIVGEIRGTEGYTLFSAMNTGHSGSMGTLHSNSAKDTMIRLTNPPMNVPVVMLNALNFIVMMQRTYDRRKGLIRRVSEIAEIIPSDTGDSHPEMNVIYKWNPAVDAIDATSEPAFFLKMVERYTGLSRNAIREELAGRQKLLADLNQRGIRDLKSVCESTQDYAQKRQGKI